MLVFTDSLEGLQYNLKIAKPFRQVLNKLLLYDEAIVLFCKDPLFILLVSARVLQGHTQKHR